MVAPVALPAAGAAAMQWLPALGSFMGGAGGMMGGIMGGGGSAVRYRANKFGGEAYRQKIKAYWGSTMKAARRHKIHPLAALGVNPASGPPPVRTGGKTGPSTGQRLKMMGQGIGEMAGAGQSEIQKAQILNLNSRTEYWNEMAEKIRRDTPVGQQDAGNKYDIRVEDLAPPKHPSYEPGIKPLEAIYSYQNKLGENVLEFLPSRDAQDYLSESWIDNMKYRVQKEAKGYATGVVKIDTKKSRAVRNRLDDLTMTHPPRPGYYYAFNFAHGRPIEIKQHKYLRAQLYDAPYLNVARYTGLGADWRNKNPKGQRRY